MVSAPLPPASARCLGIVRADLARLERYDDESIVHEVWIRQRYDLGVAASYAPARTAAVTRGGSGATCGRASATTSWGPGDTASRC